MDLQDIHKELKNLVNEHGLMFTHNPLEGGIKLEKLLSRAYIVGRRKANLEHSALKEDQKHG